MSGSQTIILEGACCLASIREKHAALAPMMRDGTAVVADVRAVSEADFSFVQLLTSASVMAARQGRSFRLQGVSPLLQQTFSRAGIGLDAETGVISQL